jgi:hypothetical protein
MFGLSESLFGNLLVTLGAQYLLTLFIERKIPYEEMEGPAVVASILQGKLSRSF